ncbi:MAG: hypothetical protein JWM91_4843 [Rhodospirillales bacterium]|nr:hypothetical protein [Rhodospirillales bacterium]
MQSSKLGDVLTTAALRSGTSWLAIFAGQGIICASAAASPITVTDTINVSQALTAGGTFTGMFDISSLLPTNGNYSTPLNILSATLAVYGYSSPASQQIIGAYSGYQQSYAGNYYYVYYYYVPGYQYYYNCGWGNTCYYNGYNQGVGATGTIYNETQYNTVTNLDDTTDTASTTIGADTLTKSDSRTVTNLGTSHTLTNGYYSGSPYGSLYYNYYSDTSTVDDFISGDLSASTALSAATLALLGQGGTLSFSTAAASGQFTITQYDLTVTLDNSISVPEPSTLSVFGFSLLLLALRARSIKRPATRQ